MRRLLRLLLILMALLVAAGTAYYFYLQHKKEHDPFTLYGNVDVRQVDLGFRVGGRIAKLYFDEGDLVAEGAKMAELDPQPYIDLMKEAKASAAASKINFENAELLLKRRQDLITDGSISQEDLENALTSKNALFANLQQAEAALGLAQTNLSDTVIYAPTTGTILTRIREPGTIVKEGDPAYTLSIQSPVWVRAFIPEPILGRVFPGMPAEVFTDTKLGKVYNGHVGFISPVAEFTPKTVETTQLRTDLVYRLRIIVDNPDLGLRQGMPVTVKLLRTKENRD